MKIWTVKYEVCYLEDALNELEKEGYTIYEIKEISHRRYTIIAYKNE